jgi:hypothetical protein
MLLLLLLLGPDGAAKGSDPAAPLKGPNPEDNGDSLYDHRDAPKLNHFSSNVRKVKHGKKGASSRADAERLQSVLHREHGYAPTLHRPTPAAVAASACASSELPPALRARLNTMCAAESDAEATMPGCGGPEPSFMTLSMADDSDPLP